MRLRIVDLRILGMQWHRDGRLTPSPEVTAIVTEKETGTEDMEIGQDTDMVVTPGAMRTDATTGMVLVQFKVTIETETSLRHLETEGTGTTTTTETETDAPPPATMAGNRATAIEGGMLTLTEAEIEIESLTGKASGRGKETETEKDRVKSG
jgi:hypothetical protein